MVAKGSMKTKKKVLEKEVKDMDDPLPHAALLSLS